MTTDYLASYLRQGLRSLSLRETNNELHACSFSGKKPKAHNHLVVLRVSEAGFTQERKIDTVYKKLALALSINAILMFLITYAMIDTFDHLYFNINRVYMTLMMVAPMVVIMLLVMGSMYKNRQLNYTLILAAIGLFVLCFSLARTQTPVGNGQFLRSMIPHHSSAIVMCQEADLSDPEIVSLCEQIVETQQEEIAQMKTILERLGE